MPIAPSLATIASQTASLTLAVFDAASATEWVHTKAAATKAQFTGHPAEIMRGLAKGEDVAAIDVGKSGGFAFELDGKSGRLEVYRLDDSTLALVAPPRAWWTEHGGDAAPADIDALFADALRADAADADDASEVGELELTSGVLAAVYIWHKKVGPARELATHVSAGGAHTFGDGYGAGDGGVVVDAGAGVHRLVKRELAADTAALGVMYLVRA